jgi:hypothetical protein
VGPLGLVVPAGQEAGPPLLALQAHAGQGRLMASWDGIDDQPLGPDGELVARPVSKHVVAISARRVGKTHAAAAGRVRKVAKGATINGTYKLNPEDALAAFRADLLILVGEG